MDGDRGGAGGRGLFVVSGDCWLHGSRLLSPSKHLIPLTGHLDPSHMHFGQYSVCRGPEL